MGVKLLIEEDRRDEKSSQLKKAYRLRKRSEFRTVLCAKQRRVGRFLSINFLARNGSSRLGITAPSRYGNAVQRNRCKRLIREAFRRLRPLFPGFDINIFPLQRAKTASFFEIYRELKWHLHELASKK